MKIVINRCYGGFSLSKEAYKFMGLEWDNYGSSFSDDRTNPKLIEVVETLGSKVASGGCAKLSVVEIPDDVSWYIDEYDGMEHVAEKHKIWS